MVCTGEALAVGPHDGGGVESRGMGLSWRHGPTFLSFLAQQGGNDGWMARILLRGKHALQSLCSTRLHRYCTHCSQCPNTFNLVFQNSRYNCVSKEMVCGLGPSSPTRHPTSWGGLAQDNKIFPKNSNREQYISARGQRRDNTKHTHSNPGSFEWKKHQ